METNILSKNFDLNKKNKIKLLISHRQNSEILTEYIKDEYQFCELSDSAKLEKADILIADEAGFEEKNTEIMNIKKNGFLPLLLLSRNDLDKLSNKYLDIVDEIVKIPIQKRLLFARINNLLNIRNLFLSIQIYQNLTENNPVGICILQENEKIKYINHAFLRIVEKKEKNILDKNIEEIFPGENIKEYLNNNQRESKDKFIIDFQAKGKKKWLNIRRSEMKFKDTKLKILILVDISDQKQSEEKIRFLSFHDQLTGLFNRNYFMEEIKRLDSSRQLPITLIMVDINNLKLINDIFGHDKGDQLIKKTANILAKNIRESDILARIGGDEFAVLLPHTTLKKGEEIISRIKNICANSEIMNIEISIALGAASKEKMDQKINDVFKLADDNMYQDKSSISRISRKKIISSLKKNLTENTNESQNHIEELEELALKIANKLNFNAEQKTRMLLLAQFHDIGKISVSDDLFEKDESSNRKEIEKLYYHCEYGYRISHSLPEISTIAEEILSHHENWDGSGYPNGLKGKEIPLLARVITVLHSYLEYKQAAANRQNSKKEVIKALKAGAGTSFDPRIVELFIDIL
ncbi:MAG: diguanylate cyclase [bacterium]